MRVKTGQVAQTSSNNRLDFQPHQMKTSAAAMPEPDQRRIRPENGGNALTSQFSSFTKDQVVAAFEAKHQSA